MRLKINNIVSLLRISFVLTLMFFYITVLSSNSRVYAGGSCSPPSDQCNNWGNCTLVCGITDCWSACTCLDPGSGDNYGCCDVNEYVCNDGGCCPIGGTDSCECGEKADGTCKSCGGGNACYPVYSCPANAVDPNTYYDWGVEERAICPIGNAQSFYQSCYDAGADGEVCVDYMRIYSCCPGSSTVACEIVDQETEYTIYVSAANRFVCSDQYDTFISTVPTNIQDQWIRTCDNYNDDASECLSNWYWTWTYKYATTCHDYNNVCACTSLCSAPTAPTLSSPADGAQLSSTTVGLYWNASTFSDGCTGGYEVYIGQTNPPTGTPISVDESTTNTNFLGTRGTTYYWYVRAENETVGADSEIRSFTILDNQITGQVFYDPNNTCSGSGWNTGGVAVSVDGGAGTAVSGTGTFSVTAAVGASHTLAVSIPAGYACSTGAGCNTCSRSGIGSPSTNNFYLTDSRESWWQAEGAGIYAGGIGGVRSILPSSSLRLILAPPGSTEGLLMTSTGTVDIGESGSVSDSGWRAISRYRGKKMDYDYFAANMGVVRGQDSDWQSDTLNLQADDGRDFWYMDPVSSTATIGAGSPWNVAGGDKHVIFVNGNLDINSDIVVEPGSFLAIIVKGDLTVDPSVADLQGLYVIDGSFVTETQYVEGVIDDIQLETGGTIVAWGSLSLSRSLGTGNITVPAEKFVYRSDLLTNMPDKMKTFVMQWNEVVPGTFQ